MSSRFLAAPPPARSDVSAAERAEPTAGPPPAEGRWRGIRSVLRRTEPLWKSADARTAWSAVFVYAGTTAVVLASVAFAVHFVPVAAGQEWAAGNGVLDSLVVFDGHWYGSIVSNGYSYDPGRQSNSPFFPAFPLLVSVVAATGLSVKSSLVAVANLSFAAAMVAFAFYARRRQGTGGDAAALSVLMMAAFPTTFYFRMGYSEPLFVLLAVLAMYSIEADWGPLATAALIGAATGTRPVGVALLLPFAVSLWEQPGSWPRRLSRLAFLPAACWGLAAFTAFQWATQGEPFAYVKAQAHWDMRPNPASLATRLVALETLEPIRDVYDPSCECYWRRFAPSGPAAFSMMFSNPFYYLGTAALIGLGAWKGWVTRHEWLLAAALLGIPYVTQSYRTCMGSEARYAAAVFPVYLVLGQMLGRVPKAAAALCVGAGMFFMAVYSMLFSRLYVFY